LHQERDSAIQPARFAGFFPLPAVKPGKTDRQCLPATSVRSEFFSSLLQQLYLIILLVDERYDCCQELAASHISAHTKKITILIFTNFISGYFCQELFPKGE